MTNTACVTITTITRTSDTQRPRAFRSGRQTRPPDQHRPAALGVTVASRQPTRSDADQVARERIALFRSLFAGRDGVYAYRWERDDKKGWSPKYDRQPGQSWAEARDARQYLAAGQTSVRGDAGRRVDPADDDAPDAWTAAFNAAPAERRRAVLGALLDGQPELLTAQLVVGDSQVAAIAPIAPGAPVPPELRRHDPDTCPDCRKPPANPPIVYPAVSELADAAYASTLLRNLVACGRWAMSGWAVTQTGFPFSCGHPVAGRSHGFAGTRFGPRFA